jgi:ABC-type transport system involved in Fe-S cluster assembly fused permease/ATPase subunit
MQILVDGEPIESYDVHHLRRHIAIVAQENILFDRSIKENVTYGLDPPPEEEEIVKACKAANAWEFISKFPEGLNMHVGARGNKLSGGQRQRVGVEWVCSYQTCTLLYSYTVHYTHTLYTILIHCTLYSYTVHYNHALYTVLIHCRWR